jgi:hypothetical protein
MAARRLVDILREIREEEPRLAKAGVQAACDFMEAGRGTPANRDRVMAALSYQLGSTDPKVLRWVYKLIALLRSPRYVNYLFRQLHDRDFDPENRLWAYTAIASISPDHRRLLYAAGDELTLAYSLAAALYRRVDDLQDSIGRAAGSDDPRAHQFVGLLYGEGRGEIPRELLSELTASPNPASAEYAIWGLRKRGGASWSDVRIDPLTVLTEQPANVRRWYYRLVAQHPESRNQLSAQVMSWIDRELESLPREGLAFGLHDSRRSWHWDGVLRDWRRVESDPFVRRALGVPAATVISDVGSPLAPTTPRRHPSPTAPRKGSFIVIETNVFNNSTIGVMQGRNSRNSGDVAISVGTTGDELFGVLQSLVTALASEPAVPAIAITELDELGETAKTTGDAPLKPDFFGRLKVVTGVIGAAATLSKATSDALDTLGAMGVLS